MSWPEAQLPEPEAGQAPAGVVPLELCSDVHAFGQHVEVESSRGDDFQFGPDRDGEAAYTALKDHISKAFETRLMLDAAAAMGNEAAE